MELQRLTTVFDGDAKQLLITFQQVDKGFSETEKKAKDGAGRIEQAMAQLGAKVGRSLKVGFGEVGNAVDLMTDLTGAALKLVPVVGEGLSSAFKSQAGAMRDAVETGFDFNDMMKRTRISLGLIAGGANDAVIELKGLRSISSSSEFSLPALVDGARQLQIMQNNSRDVVAEMRSMANAAAALDVGDSGLTAMADLFARIAETGKASTREVRGLIRLGVPALDALAEHTGLSKTRAKRLLDSGRLSAQDFIDGMLGYFDRHYPDAAQQMAETMYVQNRKMASGKAALYGAATEEWYADYVRRGQDINKLIRGPQAGQLAGAARTALKPYAFVMDQTLGALESGDLFGGVLKKAQELGDDIKAGLAKGAVGAGFDFAKGYLKEFKTGIGANSPATEFIPFGVYAAEGFKLGFLAEMKTGGGVMGLFQGGRGPLGGDIRSRLESAADDPTVQAFFEAIRKAEGGAPNRIVGGGTFTDYSHHPNRVGLVGPAGPSTAAGSFQITATNWRRIAPILGLTDFAARNQLLAALYLFNEKGGLDSLLAGDVEGAIRAAGRDWAAIPGSPLPGRHVTRESFLGDFQKALGGGVTGSVEGGFTGTLNKIVGPDGNIYDLKTIVAQQQGILTAMRSLGIGTGYRGGADLTGSVGQFIIPARAAPAAPAVQLPQGSAFHLDNSMLATSRPVDFNMRGIGSAADSWAALRVMIGDSVAQIGELGAVGTVTKKHMSELQATLLQLGLDSKTLGDSFENNFTSAFDHIGETGHNFALELLGGMAAEMKHNAGAFLAGELRAGLFGDADGTTKGIFSKLLGGFGAADSHAAVALTTNAQMTNFNTTATTLNTAALHELAFAMQTSALTGGGGGGGFLDFALGIAKSALGGISFGGGAGQSVPIGRTGIHEMIHAKSGVDFIVGGRGGTDANFVPMMLTRGERVQVTPPGHTGDASSTPTVTHLNINVNLRGGGPPDTYRTRSSQRAMTEDIARAVLSSRAFKNAIRGY